MRKARLKLPGQAVAVIDSTGLLGPDGNVITVSGGGGGGGVTAPTGYLYKNLPKATTIAAGVKAIVTDFPLYPAGREFISDGTTWLPTNIDLRQQQLVCKRQGISFANQVTTNTNNITSYNQGFGAKVKGPCTQIRLLFSNTQIPSGSIELTPGTVDFAMSASIAINPGTANVQYLRLFWEGGGNPMKTFKPGDEHWCYVDGLNLADDEFIQINTHVEFASAPAVLPNTSTSNIMLSSGPYAAYDVCEWQAGATPIADKTMTGTMPTTRQTGMLNALCLPPIAMVGMKKYSPTVAVIGDSNRSWALGGLAAAGVPAVDWGCGSYKMITVTTAARARLRRMRDAGITHVLCTMGGGDFTEGKTGAEVWALHQKFAQVVKDMGMIYIMSTSPPKATASSANSSPSFQWAGIQPYNDLVRANNGMGFGYFELFDCWGDRNTGLWRTDLGYAAAAITNSDDGTHANATIQANTFPLFAAAVPNLFK